MDKSILWESFTQVMVTNWAANIDKLEVLRSEAEAFLQANPKKDLYPVWFNRQCDDMEFCFLLPLSEDELMKARLFVEEDDDPISWDEGFYFLSATLRNLGLSKRSVSRQRMCTVLAQRSLRTGTRFLNYIR